MSDSAALVTGADKGIGKQIAAQLEAAGVDVHVGSRDRERGRQAVDEIGGRARLLVLDLTDADSIADAAREVERLDILVNNAGISLDTASAPDGADTDTFRRTYETGLAAVGPTRLRAPLPTSRTTRLTGCASSQGRWRWTTFHATCAPLIGRRDGSGRYVDLGRVPAAREVLPGSIGRPPRGR
ncbi:MAG: SDR family NAD(P)-dependent oxidoreductase [Solirubrobacteraceae bacterium]